MDTRARLAALAEAVDDPGSAQAFPFTMDRAIARWLVATARAANSLLASYDAAQSALGSPGEAEAVGALAGSVRVLQQIGDMPPEPATAYRGPRSASLAPTSRRPFDGEPGGVLAELDADGRLPFYGLAGERPGDTIVERPAPGGGIMRTLVEGGSDMYRVRIPAGGFASFVGAPEITFADGTTAVLSGPDSTEHYPAAELAGPEEAAFAAAPGPGWIAREAAQPKPLGPSLSDLGWGGNTPPLLALPLDKLRPRE